MDVQVPIKSIILPRIIAKMANYGNY